jgi:glycosyltransferase involved in cell wall biosynthesis
MSEITFSAIICTYNRSQYLPAVITSLRNQSYPADQYEIIVVDNASTDDTSHKVKQLQQIDGQPIHYIYESQLGLSHARNTGARVARGTIVAYTDDDAIASRSWLERLAQPYLEGGSEVACVGGAISLLWENAERPHWLSTEIDAYLGSTAWLGQQVRELSPGSYPYGVNLSIRKSILEQLGYFSTSLSRHGSQLLSNEEIELCHRIWATGAKIIYTPHALVSHRVPSYRTNKRYLLKRAYWQGISDVILENLQRTPNRNLVLHHFAAGLRDLGIDLFNSVLAASRQNSQAAFASLFFSASRLGRLRQEWSLFAGRESWK